MRNLLILIRTKRPQGCHSTLIFLLLLSNPSFLERGKSESQGNKYLSNSHRSLGPVVRLPHLPPGESASFVPNMPLCQTFCLCFMGKRGKWFNIENWFDSYAWSQNTWRTGPVDHQGIELKVYSNMRPKMSQHVSSAYFIYGWSQEAFPPHYQFGALSPAQERKWVNGEDRVENQATVYCSLNWMG